MVKLLYLEKMTEQEYRKIAFETTLAKSILANQQALNYNEQLKHSQFYKGKIKEFSRPLIIALLKAEKNEFDKVDKVDTNAVDNVFNQMNTVFETIAKCPFLDFEELNTVIKALAKDRSSILGIANKVLKY